MTTGARVYTDGGCHGNPGPGGWAYVIAAAGERIEASGALGDTTNNRMELTAVISALGAVAALPVPVGAVTVVTDSQYVKNGITSWIETWERNGWKTAAKKPVKNQDLWMALRALDRQLRPGWEWVKGHDGDELNERCDALVQQAIAAMK
jgi:ribonuclease HI